MTLSPFSPRRAVRWLLLCAALTCPASGCGKGSSVNTPDLSPESAAKAAMAEYDTNKDGVLDEKELASCPGLKELAGNKKQLTEAEIAGTLTKWKDSRTYVLNVPVQVVWKGGGPVVGAAVTFVPEKFLGNGLRESSGVTKDTGEVDLTTAVDNIPGCQFGIFRVKITLPDGSIPAQYNENTILGCAVDPTERGPKRLFTLTK